MTCDPKSAYQIIPLASAAASCGIASGRGRSYSVMTTCVPLPVGRGYVFNGYDQVDEELRLTLARYSAVFAITSLRTGGSPSRPAMLCARMGLPDVRPG